VNEVARELLRMARVLVDHRFIIGLYFALVLTAAILLGILVEFIADGLEEDIDTLANELAAEPWNQ